MKSNGPTPRNQGHIKVSMKPRAVQPGAVAATATAEAEFEALFTAHYLRLAKAMYLLVGDRGEAEDLAQEALGRLYERWGRVRGMDSPVGYLYRTAMNLARKRARRRRAAVEPA